MNKQEKNRDLERLRKRSEEVASLLKVLSHPQRLLILCSLIEGEKSVREIEKACDGSQSSVSQFLKSMRLENLVESRRDGQYVLYRIADSRVHELMAALYSIFCRT